MSFVWLKFPASSMVLKLSSALFSSPLSSVGVVSLSIFLVSACVPSNFLLNEMITHRRKKAVVSSFVLGTLLALKISLA